MLFGTFNARRHVPGGHADFLPMPRLLGALARPA